MHWLAKIVVAATVVSASTAQAEVLDGGALLGFYKVYRWNDPYGSATGNAMRTGYFMGYVSGVMQKTPALYCPDSGVKIGKLYDAVGKYLEAHPSELRKPADGLVVAALSESFPCNRN